MSLDVAGTSLTSATASTTANLAPVGHRVATQEHHSGGSHPRTDYTATCLDCHWIWLSRDNPWQAELDVDAHTKALRYPSDS